MINEKQIDLIIERLIRRIEQANTYFLMKIGSSIKKIRDLKPSEAQKLVQILKYGGNYEEIIKEIAKYTNLNVAEVNEIFSSYAKNDQLFYEKFYQYRNIPFTPFEENKILTTQTLALSKIVMNEMYNYTKSNVLGYTIRDIKGRPQFYGLKETYNRVLEEALLNVGQGKETFDSAMTRIMKDIGGSGLKTLNYESGRSIRLDSAIRMHLKSSLRELHNENQLIIGEEIDADGVEISVHENPAIDHEKAQGRQFSTVKPGKNKLSEWEKLQAGKEATDYKGVKVNLDHDHKNGYRPISEMNCYHYIFSIVLGVSEPEYTEKELQDIIDKNNKGFELDGKHYTMYEGTQMQRNLERMMREQKDIQIFAKASGNDELVLESQQKITQLTNKYKELSKVSGLPIKMERLRVSGYRRSKVKNSKTSEPKMEFTEPKTYLGNIEGKDYIKQITKYENNIVNSKVEKAVMIQENGDIYGFVGKEDYVDIDGDFKNAIITHNHVTFENEIGGSFGKDDFKLLMNHSDIKQLRAVDEKYLYKVSVLKELKENDYDTAMGKIINPDDEDLKHLIFKELDKEGLILYKRIAKSKLK